MLSFTMKRVLYLYFFLGGGKMESCLTGSDRPHICQLRARNARRCLTRYSCADNHEGQTDCAIWELAIAKTKWTCISSLIVACTVSLYGL